MVFVENFLAAGVAGITAMYVFFFCFFGGGVAEKKPLGLFFVFGEHLCLCICVSKGAENLHMNRDFQQNLQPSKD